MRSSTASPARRAPSRRERTSNPGSSPIQEAKTKGVPAGSSRPSSSPQVSRSRRRSGKLQEPLLPTNGSVTAKSEDDPRRAGKKGRKSRQSSGKEDVESQGTRDVSTEKSPIKEAAEDPEIRKQREKKEQELHQRWAEEYFEIVDQLPLELHRTFALMRELEGKVQGRLALIASHTKAYRDARIALDEHEASAAVSHTDGNKAESGDDEAIATSTEAARKSKTSSEGQVSRDTALASLRDGFKAAASHLWQPLGSSTDADAEGEDDDGDDDSQPVLRPPPTQSSVGAGDQSQQAMMPHSSQEAEENLPAGVPTRTARLALLGSIAKATTEAMRASDEKVGLAVTAYDWVDRHIRRLDADLQKSESSLLLGLRAGTEASRGLQDALGLTQKGESKDGVQGKATAQTSNGMPDGHQGDATFVGDMAIDPNEPRYCYCDQVSFGDMIACDNEDCPREWFHIDCVGLTQPPKGKWFCLFCAPPGFKGSGTFPPHAPCLPPSLQGSHAAASGRGRMAKRQDEGRFIKGQSTQGEIARGSSSHKHSRNHASGNSSHVRARKRKR